MKTIYSIVLLLLTTIATIHAQAPAKWNPERTPFATRNDLQATGNRFSPQDASRDGARHVSTTTATEIATIANTTTLHPFLLLTETLPEFNLSSGDFLTMSDLGLAKDPSGNGDWLETAYNDENSALKIPVGNGIYILLLLAVGYITGSKIPCKTKRKPLQIS